MLDIRNDVIPVCERLFAHNPNEPITIIAEQKDVEELLRLTKWNAEKIDEGRSSYKTFNAFGYVNSNIVTIGIGNLFSSFNVYKIRM